MSDSPIKYVMYVCFMIAGFITGCSSALPVGGNTVQAAGDTPEEIALSVQKAEQAVAEARQYHREVTSMRLRVDALQKEIAELSRKASVSTNRCKTVPKTPKKKSKVYKAGIKNKTHSSEIVNSSEQLKQQNTPTDKRTPEYPKYSPSDAPEGWHE